MLKTGKNTPRWLIFLIDSGIVLISIVLAYLVRFNFTIPESEIGEMPLIIGFIFLSRVLVFVFGKTYAGIIRYTSTKDAQRIFAVTSFTSLGYVGINLITYFLINERFYIPFSILIIEYLSTTFLLILFRLGVKWMYFEIKNPAKNKRSIIIFGAGEAGIITKRTLERDVGARYQVIAFVDDNPKKTGKKLEGVTIYDSSKLNELLQKNNVAHFIISIQNISTQRKKEIVEIALANNTRILNIPPVNSWINGELSYKQIKKINIDDLLEREPIQLDQKEIEQQLNDKVVLITGAAGSIGSELARQVMQYSPQKLILLDQAESPLYNLESELLDSYSASNIEFIVGDVRNKVRLENIFQNHSPAIIYHAAAYKHVPLMEAFPAEAILTNISGTKNVADLAVKYHATEFVLVSTDKAVNPTGVMGASKRIAEIYVQEIDQGKTNFVTTRFGNVLGSSGSVIPKFKTQINAGGPITITDPEITRFFMTIPEACQLVLQAGQLGKGGEIFLFDMGERQKIVDLATKMVKLSGLELDKDIQIKYTGLRPGEKLHEELLYNKENALPTPHPQLLIAKLQANQEGVITRIQELIDLYPSQNTDKIVELMKKIVPEFLSNNSNFEKLDIEAKEM